CQETRHLLNIGETLPISKITVHFTGSPLPIPIILRQILKQKIWWKSHSTLTLLAKQNLPTLAII
ncbi:hypothetical protein, partial [Escherichia coli]|uniref:hypothetical protein n=1 Tax=Escherichia coli TaxID=562 RepID=UPI00390C4B88